MENQEKVRKIRSKPMRWTRFFRVKNRAMVSVGERVLTKLSFCSAMQNGENAELPHIVLVNPFRRVKTTQPVKIRVEDYPVVGTVTGRPSNSGKTHFVGDDCPGGHQEIAKEIRGQYQMTPPTQSAPLDKTGPSC